MDFQIQNGAPMSISLCFVFGTSLVEACLSACLAKDLESTWKLVEGKVTWDPLTVWPRDRRWPAVSLRESARLHWGPSAIRPLVTSFGAWLLPLVGGGDTSSSSSSRDGYTCIIMSETVLIALHICTHLVLIHSHVAVDLLFSLCIGEKARETFEVAEQSLNSGSLYLEPKLLTLPLSGGRSEVAGQWG